MQILTIIIFLIAFFLFGYTFFHGLKAAVCAHRMSTQINKNLQKKGHATHFYYVASNKTEVALHSDEGSEEMEWANKHEYHKQRALKAAVAWIIFFFSLIAIKLLLSN